VIEVAAIGDTLDEDDEEFVVVLHGVTGAPVAPGRGEATRKIEDDDLPPRLSWDAAPVLEGGDGQRTRASVDWTLSSPSGREIAFRFRTRERSASEDVDYTSVEGEVVFAPGETRRRTEIEVLGDDVAEGDEELVLELDRLENVETNDPMPTVRILDDDTDRLPGLPDRPVNIDFSCLALLPRRRRSCSSRCSSSSGNPRICRRRWAARDLRVGLPQPLAIQFRPPFRHALAGRRR